MPAVPRGETTAQSDGQRRQWRHRSGALWCRGRSPTGWRDAAPVTAPSNVGPLAAGACNHRGSCSQSAAVPAQISCQRRERRAHIICHCTRYHRRLLANGRVCSHCAPMADSPGAAQMFLECLKAARVPMTVGDPRRTSASSQPLGAKFGPAGTGSAQQNRRSRHPTSSCVIRVR